MRRRHLFVFGLSLTLTGAVFAGETPEEPGPIQREAPGESMPAEEAHGQTLVLTTEIVLLPNASWSPDGSPATGFEVLRQNGRCEITCFKHSCSIECGPGKEPSCRCRNVQTPSGSQWLPFCDCRKALVAGQPVEPADRANISKSQDWVTLYKGGEAKCRRIKCTGGSADSGETIGLEVEVDDSSEGSLGKGQESDFQGKKIRIRALSRMVSYNLGDC